MSGSIAFDRAAEYYDATRGLSPEGVRRTTEVLAGAFGDDIGPVLEVGVGTGQVALPLRGAGLDVIGLDLSRPMLDRLRAKDPDRSLALIEGDATHMPLRDHVFGGAYLRWVLHLIPDWRAAVAEIVRVVRSGGALVAGLGSYGGLGAEIAARFAETTQVSRTPIGLDWDGWEELGDALEELDARRLTDLTVEAPERDDLETFVRGIEENRYSWTWAVTDEALRARAAAETRAWAEDRWGPLDRVPREIATSTFAVFRLA